MKRYILSGEEVRIMPVNQNDTNQNDNNQDDIVMKHLILKAGTTPRVSIQADERILSLISGFSPEKAKRRNPLTYLRYNPLYSLIIILPLVIILALSGTFGFFAGNAAPLPQLAFISGSAVNASDGDVLLTAGTLLQEKTVVHVAEHDVCDLAIKDRVAFRFFPSADFTVARLNKSSPQVIVELNNGSLYVDKKMKLDHRRELKIRIKNYLFVLTGTRVFFSTSEKSIQVSCFDGIVKVILLSQEMSREIYSLYAGEKIEIHTDGETREYTIRTLTAEEMLLDEELRKFLPFDRDYFTRFSLLTGAMQKKEMEEIMYEKGPVMTVSPDNTELKQELVKEKEKKPFLITEIGLLDDPVLDGQGIHFISTLPDSEQAFMITKNKLFHLKDERINEINFIDSIPSFTMRPLIAGKYLCLVSAQDIYLLNKEDLTLEKTITVSSKEVLRYHYHPVYSNMELYIPVINTGYYTADLFGTAELSGTAELTGTAEFSGTSPIVKEFFKEKFPLSPIVTKKGIYVGSYNDNYIALLDNNGESKWKYTLQGESWTNMVLKDDLLYTFISQNNGYYIIRINNNGNKDKEWQVDNKCIADIFAYKNKIFGIYINGELFSLDIKTGLLKRIGKVIDNTITSETWRSIRPYIDNTLFYIGTGSGELLCYNMEKDQQEYRIMIHENESFYAPPYCIGKSIYLVANSGKVFKIIKNEN